MQLRTGLLNLLQYCLRMKKGALFFGGAPCSAHVWISRSGTHKSRQNPLGHLRLISCSMASLHHHDPSSSLVVLVSRTQLRYGEAADIGNAIACRWALACLVVTIRQCVWVTEQPGSSLLPCLPFILFIMRLNAFGSFPGGGIISLWLACTHAFKPS